MAPHHAAWIAHEPAQLGNRSGVGDLDRGRCALLPVDGIETVGSLRPPDALTSHRALPTGKFTRGFRE
jgi:hypothetical protein